MDQTDTLIRLLEKRAVIAHYCYLARELLPAHKKILFLLYFEYGFSTIEIGQLIMKHPSTVARRLQRIADELLVKRELEYGKNS